MPGGRRTRPWGPLRGPTPQDDAVATLMRSWMDEAGLKVTELHKALTREHLSGGPVPSRTGVGERLSGLYLAPEFVDAVAMICAPNEATGRAWARQGRAVLDRRAGAAEWPGPTLPAIVDPLALSQLHRQVEDLKDGLGDDAAQRFDQLHRENAQLRMNVGELGKRVHSLTKQLGVLEGERDELRRHGEKTLRALAALQSKVRALTEQLEHGPRSGDTPPEPFPPTTFDDGPKGDHDDGPPAQEAPPTGPGRPPAPRNPPTGPSAAGGTAGPVTPGTPAAVAGGSHQEAPAAPAEQVVDATPVDRTETAVPVAFRAFVEANLHRYSAYAGLHLPQGPAQSAVEKTFSTVLEHWQQFLGHQMPAAWAWQILRHNVAAEVQAASRHFEVARAIRVARIKLEAMASEVGLYAAIAALPERQFDVVVLRYILNYSVSETAALLGVSTTTVRAHQQLARRRLAVELNLDAEETELAQ